MKYVFIIAFVLMIGAQWYVPLKMVSDSEDTLLEGVEYKFKTRPVDPADPFRGKYVTLDFEAETYHPLDTNEAHYQPRDRVYAVISEEQGYAVVQQLLSEPPELPLPFVEASVQYAVGRTPILGGEATVVLNFPFDKFYLEESKASEAERLYWQSRLDTTMVCYAKVRIHNGHARLVDVVVNDSSIVDVVRRINANKP